MKLLRWLRCSLNLGHRLDEIRQPLTESGLTEFSAALYGCTIKDGMVNAFKCRDCSAVCAPFEVAERGWRVAQ